ncbi:uncharacterized protein [Phaseolus vulgaris]|uniref:uncharacterized protein isoform X1 n=1 Tax=Phaseolus vulgaris TaxID=3885 RepID=UPI0035CC16F2
MKCASAIPARNMVLLLHHGTCFNLRSTSEPLVYKKVQGVLRSQLQTANEDTETKNRRLKEDEKLIRYITTHDYGCWIEVPFGSFFYQTWFFTIRFLIKEVCPQILDIKRSIRD